MQMKLPFLASLFLCACMFTFRVPLAAEPEASRIFGIGKIIVGANSVRVTKDESLPYQLDLIPGSGDSESAVKSLAIGVGDSFTISDRHHLSVAYRLVEIAGNVALMEETRWTRFPDKGEHKGTHTVLIRAYGDK